MDKYLKMADVFGDAVAQKIIGDAHEIMSHVYGHICVVNTKERADIIANAINSHDELVAEVERLRRQLHFCEASRGQLIDQINRMKRDVFEGKHQQKPYL